MQLKVMVGLCLVSVGILAPVWGFVSTFRTLIGSIRDADAGAGGQVPAVLAVQMQRSLMLAFGLLLAGVVIGLIGLGLTLSGLKGEDGAEQAAEGSGKSRA